jgi:hypothetical protein
MKNTTVIELIEILKQMNPNAVVCNLEMEDDKPFYSTFEKCVEIKDVEYIDDSGDYKRGDIVAIY